MQNSIDKEQPVPQETTLPHQQFDIVAKDPFYVFPVDMLQFLMNRQDFEFIEHVDSNLTTVEVRHMDVLIKVQVDEQPVLIHCEIQTDDSQNPDMVRRNVGYLGRCYEKYGLPVYSFVLYLRSTAGRRDPGGYFQNIPGHRFIVEYQVIRLSEVDGQSILEAQHPGLMPFTPLMRPPVGMSGVEWTERCAEVTQSLPLETKARSNLMVELWVMSGLAHERQHISTLLSEDIMEQSSIYQMIIERGVERGVERGIKQGIEQGAKRTTIESILALLNNRFDVSNAPNLNYQLEKIDDLPQLKALFQEALNVENLENFMQTLQAYENGN